MAGDPAWQTLYSVTRQALCSNIMANNTRGEQISVGAAERQALALADGGNQHCIGVG